jgi:nitrate reductase gamma subunit
MTEAQWLLWLRGTGLQIASVVFVLGLVFRILQNLTVGRSVNLAPARGNAFGAGLATIARRSLVYPDKSYRGYFITIMGYIFHIGFLLTLLFLSQHIILFKSVFGFSWPALPPALIDVFTLLAIAALIAVLLRRVLDPVTRLLSDYQDYLTWTLTILPLVTGFIAMHPWGLSYATSLSLHLMSVELLLIAIPFTKLSHMASLFISRWYNGAIAGYRGVKS